MNITRDNILGSSQKSWEQDMTLLDRLIKEFDPGDVLMSSPSDFRNLANLSPQERSILYTIHKRFEVEYKSIYPKQFMRLIVKALSRRAMESNNLNVPSDSGVEQDTPPFEVAQPIQIIVGYEGGRVDGVTYETENQNPDEIQDAAAYDCSKYSGVNLIPKELEVVTGVTAEELLNGADNAYCTDGIEQAQGNHYVSSAPMIVTSPPIQV